VPKDPREALRALIVEATTGKGREQAREADQASAHNAFTGKRAGGLSAASPLPNSYTTGALA
jgi:hypothetical protein